jgi:O-antigen/teichoic acid export membrane protein
MKIVLKAGRAAVRIVPVQTRLLAGRASWALVDQGVVSLGNFLLNVLLARHLVAADYGTFALFLSAIFALHAVDYSLISYPLSVRLCKMPDEEHPALLGNTALLAALLSLVLLAPLVLGIALLGQRDILLGAGLYYLSRQLQETARRCLLASFRYRAAVAGDTVSFVGQAMLIWMFTRIGTLTVSSALCAMSATFVAGAIMHVARLRFARPHLLSAGRLSREYFSIGKWSLVNNELVLFRIQLFPWALAAAAGMAATASFQASMNIANLMNPIRLGIGNAVPQAAAQAHASGGIAAAWRIARGYVLFGLPMVLLVCAAGVVAPNRLLSAVYGGASPYLALSISVQLLAVAWAGDYIAEMLSNTLLGVRAGRLASLVNLVGFAAAAVALPLILPFGVVGACLALLIANLVRIVAAWTAMKWLIANEGSREEVPAQQEIPAEPVAERMVVTLKAAPRGAEGS